MSRGRVGLGTPGMKGPVFGASHAQVGHSDGEDSTEEIVGLILIDGFLDKSIVEGKSELDGEPLIGAVLLCKDEEPATVSCASCYGSDPCILVQGNPFGELAGDGGEDCPVVLLDSCDFVETLLDLVFEPVLDIDQVFPLLPLCFASLTNVD